MYDHFAAAYAADNESNAFNALYERPAMPALLGNCAANAYWMPAAGPEQC